MEFQNLLYSILYIYEQDRWSFTYLISHIDKEDPCLSQKNLKTVLYNLDALLICASVFISIWSVKETFVVHCWREISRSEGYMFYMSPDSSEFFFFDVRVQHYSPDIKKIKLVESLYSCCKEDIKNLQLFSSFDNISHVQPAE